MNKFVMLTDTHLGLQNSNKFWLDLTKKLFDEIIDLCYRESIDHILHIGDFFDNRKSINVLTMNTALDIVNKIEENGLVLYVLKGNHDQYYKNLPNPHSLQFLKLKKSGVYVVDKITDIDGFYMVPWGEDISSLPDNSTIMGHFEINGFPTNYTGKVLTNSKYNLENFRRFRKVYSGHFHKRSKVENVEYIGSAFPINFNDIGEKRGYYVFDENGTEFFEFTSAPKFMAFTSEDEIGDIEGNIVRYTFIKDYGSVKTDQLISKLYEKNPLKVFIDYDIKVEGEDEEISEEIQTGDNSQILVDYIEKQELPSHIRKEVLKKMLEKIDKEV